MRKKLLGLLALVIMSGVAAAQNNPTPAKAGPSPTPAPRRPAGLDLAAYGVSFQPDQRLIVVMAALDAAGFDPTPPGKEPSFFRTQIRRDLAGLDPGLRERLKSFYERTRLPAPATPADQAARYVSLAYTLGPPPGLDPPERSDDLPGGVLEVLDFAPLVREFYRKSGIDERIISYVRAYQSEGDRLRQPTGEMVQGVLSYLHTQPDLIARERVKVNSPGTKKKKDAGPTYSVREHERHFYVVPDLLGAPGAINFRIIADDYYAVVPEGINPAASELRRAYIQYVIDPVVLRYNREVAARREKIKQLLDERARAGSQVSPDVFITVSRSLVAATEARVEEKLRLAALQNNTSSALRAARDETARTQISKEAQQARAAIADETVAKLAGDYEKGAVLAFYFADQLRDLEVAGFGFKDFFADMIASFDPAREAGRPAGYAAATARAMAARKARAAYSQWLVNPGGLVESTESGASRPGASLIKGLTEVEKLLQMKNYEGAENRLRSLMQDFPGEPRIMFTMGQTASLWARDSTDDAVQAERLNRALGNYQLAVGAASADRDRVLLSRAHEAMGRILAFLDRDAEALKEFNAAISLGDIAGGAFKDAVEGKKKLSQPK